MSSKYPGISQPLPTIDSMHNTVLELKEVVETLIKSRGDPLQHAVNLQDLANLGLSNVNQIARSAQAYVGSAVLTTGTATALASVTLPLDLPEYKDYKIFKLLVYTALAATDATVPFLRFSDDGGATFEADAADYGWDYDGSVTGTAIDTGDASDSEIELCDATGNAAGEGFSFEITILNPAATATTTRAHWIGHRVDDSGVFANIAGSGRCLVAAASTDVQLIMSSGNITCSYTLMGVK